MCDEPGHQRLRFMLKHLDGELGKLLEATVPPVDLTAVSAFRAVMMKHAKKAGCILLLRLLRY